MYDVIIIGAGPAGLAAALYAGRYRMNILVLEKMCVGGQIILSSTIENFPGFPGGISTQELIDKFKQQVDELGTNIVIEDVLELGLNSKLKTPIYNIKTSDKSYEAKSVIVACGAQSKRLGVKGEDRLTGHGVSYCATCDGPLFRDKDVVVVGGGDRALEEAIFLTSYARQVSVIHRRQQLRASKILEEKAKQNTKINFILDSVVEEIVGINRVEAVKIKDIKTDSESNLPCQGVFIFVGIQPNTAFLNQLLQMDQSGFIITDQEMKTSRDGMFACGDCRRKGLYQVVNACAEGAVAAHSAHKYLLSL